MRYKMITEAIISKGGKKLKVRLKDQQKFKVLMARKGYSQRGLAEKIKMSYEYLNLISNERLNPSGKIANKIATALEMEFDDLFFIEIDDRCNQQTK